MKTRKLKWKKDNAIKDRIMNCCSWFARDKKTNISFDVVYYIDDDKDNKFSIDLAAWIGDSNDNFILKENIPTKWDLKRFEKLELRGFQNLLVGDVESKLYDLMEAIKYIKRHEG
jgi:hypothetical protein